MTLPDFIDVDTVRNIVLVLLAVMALLAYLAFRMITSMVTRVVTIALIVGAGIWLYGQRGTLEDCRADCECTILGIEVSIPDDVLDQFGCPTA